MNHTVITIDIATRAPFDHYYLRMKLDDLLADYPLEFEDWKVRWFEEKREI